MARLRERGVSRSSWGVSGSARGGGCKLRGTKIPRAKLLTRACRQGKFGESVQTMCMEWIGSSICYGRPFIRSQRAAGRAGMRGGCDRGSKPRRAPANYCQPDWNRADTPMLRVGRGTQQHVRRAGSLETSAGGAREGQWPFATSLPNGGPTSSTSSNDKPEFIEDRYANSRGCRDFPV